MIDDLSFIWNFESTRSPARGHGATRQILKSVEEIGELASAHLTGDQELVKQELADTLNALLGLSTVVFEDYAEFVTYLADALRKMSVKYEVTPIDLSMVAGRSDDD